MPNTRLEKVGKPAFRAGDIQRPPRHFRFAWEAFSPAFRLFEDAGSIKGMTWWEILIGKLFDWLLEIPLNLLGRKVERLLDQAAERRRRARTKGRRKLGSRKWQR